MSAGPDFAFSKQLVSAAPAQSFNPIAMSRSEGRPVVCSPRQLRVHPALQELGWTGPINEFNNATRLKDQPVPVPILITTNGTILAGFGRWRSALSDDRHEINCIEYPLSEEEALRFIISHHQPQSGWNAFIRIRLALRLKANFQQRAFDNMSAGGKYKGSTNLPDADCIDVRQEIANHAGTGTSNVAKVAEPAPFFGQLAQPHSQLAVLRPSPIPIRPTMNLDQPAGASL